jgi:hypothetical protein
MDRLCVEASVEQTHHIANKDSSKSKEFTEKR